MLEKVRPEVRGRSAVGLLQAQLKLEEYGFMQKFKLPRRGAKGQGVRFEAQVIKKLESHYPEFFSSPVFRFTTLYAAKAVCVPDGILFCKDELIIIEIKRNHTIDAWYQLNYLYSPVVQKALPGRKVRLLEICSVYHPEEVFPDRFSFVRSLEEFKNERGVELGVMIWG